MKALLAVLAVASLSIGSVPTAGAQMKHGDMKGMDHGGMDAKSQTHKGTGVVTGIDRNAGKLTLKHEPIQSLNWPAMTMAFEVKDKSLLDKAKLGDRIDFTLAESGRKYVITAIK